jgi:WD40 repeat protein
MHHIVLILILLSGFFQQQPVDVTQFEQLHIFGSSYINDLAVHPDGEVLAVASTAGVWLMSLPDLQPLQLVETDALTRVQWSVDGTRLAGQDTSNTFLLDYRDGQLIALQHVPSDRNLFLSPDLSRAVFFVLDHVNILDTASGGDMLQMSWAWLSADVVWSPDSEMLLMHSPTGDVGVVDATTGEVITMLFESVDAAVHQIEAIWQDGRLILQMDNITWVVDTNTWEKSRLDTGFDPLSTNVEIRPFLSPDGSRLWLYEEHQPAELWDMTTRQRISRYDTHLLRYPRTAVWLGDVLMLLDQPYPEQGFHYLEPETGTILATFPGMSVPSNIIGWRDDRLLVSYPLVITVALSPENGDPVELQRGDLAHLRPPLQPGRLFLKTGDETTTVVDYGSGDALVTTTEVWDSVVWADTWVVVGRSDAVRVISLRDGTVLYESERQFSAMIDGMAVSPNGRWLAYGDDNTIHLVDTASWQEVTTLSHNGTPDMAWSPDGTRLASIGGGFIKIWGIPE